MVALRDDFAGELSPHWNTSLVGQGTLTMGESRMRLGVTGASSRRYSNAQIDDYQGLRRRRFPWAPPLRLSVRARFSGPAQTLRGTAGFGFWNDPFMMTGARLPNLPRALWYFFGSPPSNMKLDLHAPGHGWKAATIDALRPISPALGMIALPAVALMNVRPFYRALWPPIQRALRVQEAPLETDMAEWHTYEIEWGASHSHFRVDGTAVLTGAPSPRGPLGFVLWMDNQSLEITPWGRVRWGLLDIPDDQWMDVDWVELA